MLIIKSLLDRNIKMVNLDPGAENLPYESDIDIRNLTYIDEIMKETNLGPNESLIYAMEALLTNIEWLENEFSKLSNDCYLIIDLPGQVLHYIFCILLLYSLCRLNCTLTILLFQKYSLISQTRILSTIDLHQYS